MKGPFLCILKSGRHCDHAEQGICSWCHHQFLDVFRELPNGASHIFPHY